MPRRSLVAFDLKAARVKRGLSQVEASEILCSTQNSVSRWEALGNMPAVYRKAWALHWELEAIKVKMTGGADVSLANIARKHDDMRTQSRKVNVPNVSSTNKEQNDVTGPIDSNRKVKPRGRTPVSRAKAVKRSGNELQTSAGNVAQENANDGTSSVE